MGPNAGLSHAGIIIHKVAEPWGDLNGLAKRDEPQDRHIEAVWGRRREVRSRPPLEGSHGRRYLRPSVEYNEMTASAKLSSELDRWPADAHAGPLRVRVAWSPERLSWRGIAEAARSVARQVVSRLGLPNSMVERVVQL